MACLDTTFILDLRGRGGANLQSRARTTLHQLIQTGQAITTTRINVAELYVGVERSHNPTRELALLSSILSTVEILEADERSAGSSAEPAPTCSASAGPLVTSTPSLVQSPRSTDKPSSPATPAISPTSPASPSKRTDPAC